MQSILYLFWVSLISSLNLFLFCLFFYIKILTFDYYLIEHIFSFFIINSSFKEIIINSISWYILIFCLFLKCGIAPLYIWKPSFFKGLPFYTLFIYIYFFLFFYIYIYYSFINVILFWNILFLLVNCNTIYCSWFNDAFIYCLWGVLHKNIFSN